jgi:hypothetical protein
MKSLRPIFTRLFVAALASGLCGSAVAQVYLEGTPSRPNSGVQWLPRGSSRLAAAAAPAPSADEPALTDYRSAAPRVAYQQPPVRRASSYAAPAVRHTAAAEIEPAAEPSASPPEPIGPGKVVSEPPVHQQEPIIDNSDWTRQPGCDTCGGYGGGEAIGGDCGGGCRPCYDGRGPCPCCGGCGNWLFHDMALFGGLQGFKGPADQARNGNFGFIEGFNFGAPLGLGNFGFQAGFAATQSNFSGHNVLENRNGTRHQFLLTGGVFRRAPCGGLQGGVVFDYMSDSYYYGYYNNDQQAHLKQIRSEASYVGPYGHEIGYMGSYAIGGHQVANLQLDPTDVFALFYRRQFQGGGSGRFWAGASGHGDGVLGAEVLVPLGNRWAIENRFTYLIPKQGRGNEGQLTENWAISVSLVWYMGQSAKCSQISPFRPLFGVADNSTFLVRGSNWQQFQPQ